MSRRAHRRRGLRVALAGTLINWLAAAAIGELALAFVLGGSASRNDLALMVIELGSLPLLATGLWRIFNDGSPKGAIFPLVLLAGLCCLPLLQLLPLPPALWNSLPGRSAAIQTLTLARIDEAWRPLSLTPDATWRSFLWLLPPASLFLATVQLDKAARVALAVVILALLALSLLIAGLQFAGVPNLHFDPMGNNDLPNGLFANRNHQADAMVIGLPLSAAIAVMWSRSASVSQSLASHLFIGATGLFAAGALVTLSRAGLILGGLGLIGAIAIYFRNQSARPKKFRSKNLILLAVAIVVIVIAQFGLGAVMSRFDRSSEAEARLRFWPTIVAVAEGHFPAGAGLGAFDPVYRSAEPPETVGNAFVNAAHNDYLQVWLEGGVTGLALLFAFLAWFAGTAFRVWSAPPQIGDALAQGACLAIGIMLLHSLADYPLRTPALASVFAVLGGLVAVAARELPISRQH